jgi:hypothetical protein
MLRCISLERRQAAKLPPYPHLASFILTSLTHSFTAQPVNLRSHITTIRIPPHYQRHLAARANAPRRGVSATQVATTTNTLPYIDTDKEGPMTKHPYINSGASAAEEVVMDHYHEDTELVRAGLSPTNQSDDELDRAEPTAQVHMEDNTQLCSAGSSPTIQGDGELERVERTVQDHLDDDTELVRTGSPPTDLSDDELLPTVHEYLDDDSQLVRTGSTPANVSDDELDRARPKAMNHLDDDTRLVRAGLPPADQSDDELDRAEPRLRLELLASIFAAEPAQLKDIEPPPACYQFPDQASDILLKYVYCTVFHVKVWINFDAHEDVFFEGARSSACGKLRLPGNIYRALEDVKASALIFGHVCFEIGTPFRTLATVDLIAEQGRDGARPQVLAELALVHADKRRLNAYLHRACQVIERNSNGDDDGLIFQDLEEIASLFCRDREVSPGRNEDWEDPAYGGGEWAGVEDPYKVRQFTRYIW